MDFPITPILDDFNRANEGPPPSSNWIESFFTGGLKVSSNALVLNVPDTDDAITWHEPFGPDQEAYFRMLSFWLITDPLPGSVALRLRQQVIDDSETDHYSLDITPDTVFGEFKVEIWKLVGVTYTMLSQVLEVVLVVGDQLGVRIRGNVIKGYLNGVEIITATDSSIPSGQYISIVNGKAENVILDDFGGGEIPLDTTPRNTQTNLRWR